MLEEERAARLALVVTGLLTDFREREVFVRAGFPALVVDFFLAEVVEDFRLALTVALAGARCPFFFAGCDFADLDFTCFATHPIRYQTGSTRLT